MPLPLPFDDGPTPDPSADSSTEPSPAVCIVHPLPAAPNFVGRARELDQLRRFWQDPKARVVGLIGLGGAGKTALAAEFLKELLAPSPAALAPPDKLFVWSFYADQDTASFLREAYRYFTGEAIAGGGLGVVYRLAEALAKAGRALIVLDGLERVQRPRAAGGLYGEFEDVLLRQAVVRLAHGVGRAKCLITSRFPVADIDPWQGESFWHLDVDRLDADSARRLLRQRGVRGDDRRLDRLLADFGTHALTLDHLGSYLAHFRGGDPDAADALPPPPPETARSASAEECHLARVLLAYRKSLSKRETSLLAYLCLFRTGVAPVTLHRLLETEAKATSGRAPTYRSAPVPSEEEVEEAVGRLARLHLMLRESPDRYTAHPAVRDFFERDLPGAARLHAAIADRLGGGISAEAGEAWKKLLGRPHVPPRRFSRRGRPPPEPFPPAPELIRDLHDFMNRFRTELAPETFEQVADFAERLGRGEAVVEDLYRLSVVRLGARPGRGSPRTKQELDAVEELIYHLIRAGQGDAARQLYRHDFKGRHYLAFELGEYARGARVLQMFPPDWEREDLAWYFRGTGDLESARRLMDHKNSIWGGTILCLQGRLREVSAGRYFPSTKDCAAFLRGEFAMRLTPGKVPYFYHGEAIADAEYFVYRSEWDWAREVAEKGLTTFGPTMMPERTRCLLVLAEVARQREDWAAAGRHVAAAEEWITRSGSAEHVCLLHLTRGRLSRSRADWEESASALGHGRLLARRCGLGLLHVDLSNELAATLLERARRAEGEARTSTLSEAEACLTAALNGIRAADGRPADGPDSPAEALAVLGAAHPLCGYVWGQARARELLARLAALREGPA